MANLPLDQRLSQMLPSAAPAIAAEDISLEPMPGAAQAMETEPPLEADPGTPSMEEGIQVAGPIDAAMRKLITRQAAKAERSLVPDAARAAEGELPDAAKVGRFKLIPEADQTLTDTVGAAVKARQAAAPTLASPAPRLPSAWPVCPMSPSTCHATRPRMQQPLWAEWPMRLGSRPRR